MLKGEGELKELLGNWNEESAGKNGDNKGEEQTAKEVEWAGNHVDKDKINRKDDNGRKGSELCTREIIIGGNDRED